jgi:lysophospholipid acyltransferase (LPLAT)-like uncharacterized protein
MGMNRYRTEIKWKLVGIFGKLFIDLLFHTTTIQTEGFESVANIIDSRKFILVFWHARIPLISYCHKGLDAAIMVSRSDDGEIIARIIEKQGHEAVRGSTGKGGMRALNQIIRKLKERNRPGVIIPDGPQGPRYRVQPGVILLAKKTGYPIIPVTYSARRIKVFASWDQFILPYPFTNCRMVYGKPVTVPQGLDDAKDRDCQIELENELRRITRRADQTYGHDLL